jgi:hypothetical protein
MVLTRFESLNMLGATTAYKGTHSQAMPFFNGSILFFLNASSFTASATATTIHTDTAKPIGSSKSKYF